MTNQAAQTMPELPARVDLYSTTTGRGWGYTADQMRAMYQQGYAAALSQTAGVAEVKRDREGDRLRFHDPDFNAWLDAGISDAGHTVYDLISSIEDAWQGWHGHVLSVMLDENPDLDAMLAAAPAASGVHPDALQDGTLSKSTAKRLAAASVSERARSASLKEIVPAEKRNYLDDNGNPSSIEDEAYAHGWNACRAATLRALEQALTQQRGDGEAVDRDAWAEALELPQGYTVEEFLPGGWHYAWTRADGERMVSGTTWNHPALAAIAAWQYAPATTPQPGAEALRELVQRWRSNAEHTDGSKWDHGHNKGLIRCASELESLLARGGK